MQLKFDWLIVLENPRQWIHEHIFEARDGRTLARDHVRYAVPLDFLLHCWFVRPDIERIFKFRMEALRTRFAASQAVQP